MKHLYLISGTMGVGKTTTCMLLKKQLKNAVFLDGDWCWDADPFTVTDETKKMVVDNICHLLNNFIACSAYDNVIFCWVMHEQGIIDGILSRLNTDGCKVVPISLVCTMDALTSRLQKDIAHGLRDESIVMKSTMRLALYQNLNTIKIDTSTRTPEEVARDIRIQYGK